MKITFNTQLKVKRNFQVKFEHLLVHLRYSRYLYIIVVINTCTGVYIVAGETS